VIKSLLNDGTFKVRGVTTNPDSEKGQELKRLGAEIIYGETKNPKSMKDCFKNAYGAFIVVNFWDPEIMTNEDKVTKEIMKLAKESGIKHLVYSGLPNVESATNGKIEVPHFTLKAKSVEYAKSLNFQYFTNVEPAFYYANWFTFFKPTKIDGTWTWTLPIREAFSQFDPCEDMGPAVLTAFKHPEMWNGRDILLQGDYISPVDVVRIIGEVTDKPTQFKYLAPDDYLKKFPDMKEMTHMFEWFSEYGYFGEESETRQWNSGRLANPNMLGFKQWMETGLYKEFFQFE